MKEKKNKKVIKKTNKTITKKNDIKTTNNTNNKIDLRKPPYITGIILAIVLVLSITVYSYLYFSGNINNIFKPKESKPAPKMEVDYKDGKDIVLSSELSDNFIEKNFTVKNSGNLETVYDIYLSDIVNDFVDKSNLVFYIMSIDGKSTKTIEFPSENTKVISNLVIPPNTTHHYILRVEFKDKTNINSDDANKILKGNIDIEENKDIQIEYTLSLDNYNESKKTAEKICLTNNFNNSFCIYPNYWYMKTGATNDNPNDGKSVALDLIEEMEIKLNYIPQYSSSEATKATVGPKEQFTCTAYNTGKVECSILNDDKTVKQKYVLSENGEVLE